jgi:hypothetical protein
MAIRVIVRTDDAGQAANCDGGKVATTFKTFDIENLVLEAYLREESSYSQRQVIGVELLPISI